jgi:hypothetical protein
MEQLGAYQEKLEEWEKQQKDWESLKHKLQQT